MHIIFFSFSLFFLILHKRDIYKFNAQTIHFHVFYIYITKIIHSRITFYIFDQRSIFREVLKPIMLSGTPFHRKLSFLSLFTLIHPYHRQAVVVWQDSATSLQAQTRDAFPLLTKLIDNNSSGSRSSEMGEEWVEKFRVKCLQEFRNSWPTS